MSSRYILDIILTSLRPVTEYACPFTSFLKVTASMSKALVIYQTNKKKMVIFIWIIHQCCVVSPGQ